MTLHRFFVDANAMSGDRFPLPPAIERQVRTVLRLGSGERIMLLPNDGTATLCRLDGGMCVVEARQAVAGEPRHRITVVQALLKGDGLEEAIRQGTEIGVADFRLVVTDRCIARDISARKLARLRAVAREAAEQSERGIIPTIDPPVRLAEAFEPGSVLLFERHDGASLAELSPPSAIVIGPEGGFSPAEVEAARLAGVGLAGLGPRILRSQTVAVAAVAVILSRAGDFA